MDLNDLKNNSWVVEENKLKKEFNFKGYLKTISFVNAIAWEANRQNHHPELLVTYNKCIVTLTTHDSNNTVTDKDIKLATIIEKLSEGI